MGRDRGRAVWRLGGDGKGRRGVRDGIEGGREAYTRMRASDAGSLVKMSRGAEARGWKGGGDSAESAKLGAGVEGGDSAESAKAYRSGIESGCHCLLN